MVTVCVDCITDLYVCVVEPQWRPRAVAPGRCCLGNQAVYWFSGSTILGRPLMYFFYILHMQRFNTITGTPRYCELVTAGGVGYVASLNTLFSVLRTLEHLKVIKSACKNI